MVSVLSASFWLFLAQFAYFVLGNAVIGIAEGMFILGAVRRAGEQPCPTWFALAMMTTGNYLAFVVAALAADMATARLIMRLAEGGLPTLLRSMAAIYLGYFVVSGAIKYVVALCLRGAIPHGKFAGLFLKIQLLVAFVVVLFLAMFSTTTLLRLTRPTASADFRKPLAATVYFLSESPSGNEVRTLRLDSGAEVSFCSIPTPISGHLPWRLRIVKAKTGWGIAREPDFYFDEGDTPQTVLTFAPGEESRLAPEADWKKFSRPAPPFSTYSSDSIDWRPSASRAKEEPIDISPRRGAIFVDGQALGLALPLLSDPGLRNPTVLPTNQLIFSFAGAYILLLDLETMKLAVLAKGAFPVMVLDAPREGS